MPHYRSETAPGFALPRIELTGESDAQRYLVRARGQIVRLLKQLKGAGALITGYYGSDERYILCTLLAVEADDAQLIFSGTSNTETAAQIGAAPQLLCVSSYRNVRLQWRSEHLQLIDYQGEPAILAPLPDSVLHLQRREFHRLTTPVANPARCLLNPVPQPPSDHSDSPARGADGTPAGSATSGARKPGTEVTLVDISCGGIGILDYAQALDLRPGVVYHDCTLLLDEFGEYSVSVEIRNTYTVTLTNGKPAQRAGCAFLNLSPRINAALQRYIHALDMKRHGHVGDTLKG